MSVILFSSVPDVSVSWYGLQLNPYNPPFVGSTSKLQLHHQADLNSNYGPFQQYIHDYDMTKRTLIEFANPYPHTPITMQSSRNPDTAGSGFRCMFKFLQMPVQFGCRLNNCLCNRQPPRFTPSNYAVRYKQKKSCIVMAPRRPTFLPA